MKKIITIITILCLLACSATCSLAAQSSGWQSAYADVLVKQTLSNVAGNVVMLRDIDLDGTPELFFGYDSIPSGKVEAAWTYKNGKLGNISIPAVSADSEAEPVSISNIEKACLYYNAASDEFRIYSPTVVAYGGGGGEDIWSRLLYDGSSLKNSSFVYKINWYNQFDAETEKYTKTEESYQFRNTEMNKITFYNRLASFYSGWLCVDTATLKAENGSTAYAENMPDVSDILLFKSDSNGQYQWDRAAVEKFMKQWTPTVVKGTQTARANAMGLSIAGGSSIQVPAYLIFGNNYIKLRDLAASLSDTEYAFDVSWDGQSVQLAGDKNYSGDKEQSAQSSASASAKYSKQRIYLDGEEFALTAYIINGSNYVRLRDAGAALGFTVGWNDATRTVSIP